MSEHLTEKSDAELQDILNSSRAVLNARKAKTRKAKAKELQVAENRKNHLEWEKKITAFTDALLLPIKNAFVKGRPPHKALMIDLPEALPEATIYATLGYAQVIHAICRKYNVSITFKYDDGFVSNWGSDWPTTKATVTFGQVLNSKAEFETLSTLLLKIEEI